MNGEDLEVHVHVARHPIAMLPLTHVEAGNWVTDAFQRKDRYTFTMTSLAFLR